MTKFGKLLFSLILLILCGFAFYYFFFDQSRNQPPSLSLDSRTFQGFIVERDDGLFELEETDIRAFQHLAQSLVEEPTPLEGRSFNYLWTPKDTTFGEIAENLAPDSAYYIVHYNPAENSWFGWKDVPSYYAGQVQTMEDPEDYSLQAGDGFIVISSAESSIHTFQDASSEKPIELRDSLCNEAENGWHLIKTAANDVKELTCERAQYFWVYSGKNKNGEDHFTKVTDLNNAEYPNGNIAWVKLQNKPEKSSTSPASTSASDTSASTDSRGSTEVEDEDQGEAPAEQGISIRDITQLDEDTTPREESPTRTESDDSTSIFDIDDPRISLEREYNDSREPQSTGREISNTERSAEPSEQPEESTLERPINTVCTPNTPASATLATFKAFGEKDALALYNSFPQYEQQQLERYFKSKHASYNRPTNYALNQVIQNIISKIVDEAKNNPEEFKSLLSATDRKALLENPELFDHTIEFLEYTLQVYELVDSVAAQEDPNVQQFLTNEFQSFLELTDTLYRSQNSIFLRLWDLDYGIFDKELQDLQEAKAVATRTVDRTTSQVTLEIGEKTRTIEVYYSADEDTCPGWIANFPQKMINKVLQDKYRGTPIPDATFISLPPASLETHFNKYLCYFIEDFSAIHGSPEGGWQSGGITFTPTCSPARR